MTLFQRAAIDLPATWWVVQSLLALIKTARARTLYQRHRAGSDHPVAVATPRAAVIVAVKGAGAALPDFLDGLLDQDHPDHHVLFVTECADDPAHSILRDRIAQLPPGKARLLVAGPAENCGQKVHNQLAAMRELEPGDRIIAFADADITIRTDWLRCLVAPLKPGHTDFTTGYRWFIPANLNLPNRVVALIGAGIEPWLGPNWRMCLWGGSMAVTRKAFDELRIPENLRGSINDDIHMAKLARQAGKRMRYVRSVEALTPVDFTCRSFFEFARRQYFQLRVFHPLLWVMALAVPALFLTSFTGCLVRLVAGDLWMTGVLVAALAMGIARTTIRVDYLTRRFPAGEAAMLVQAVRGGWWLDPLVHFLHFLVIVSSGIGREIVWAGIRYRVTGPQATEVSGRDTVPVERR